MVRKADLGFLDRIRREVHVDVAADERGQVDFQSGTGEGYRLGKHSAIGLPMIHYRCSVISLRCNRASTPFL
jgi:hypothetical protein